MNAAQARYEAQRREAQKAASQRQAMRAQVARYCEKVTQDRDVATVAYLATRGIKATVTAAA